MRKIITYTLYIVAFTSIFLASGIKDIANWWKIAMPFFMVFLISITLALTLTYINKIRRVIYPVFVCANAWAYTRRIIRTDFARKAYRLYKWQNRSYLNLFDYVQSVFDVVYM